MKKLKLFCTYLAVAVILNLLLTGCGSQSPDESLINSDMNSCLSNQYSNSYEFIDLDTVQSITEGNRYTATVNAIAKDSYAQLYLTIEMQYTKYDQGWQNDFMYMSLNDCTIHTYPDEAEIAALYNIRNSEASWEATYTDYEVNGDSITGYGYIDTPYNEYFKLKGDVTTYWSYDLLENQWIIEDEFLECYGVLACSIEGSFNIYNGTGSRIHIRNQTETSLEVYNTSEEDEWVKVDLQTYGNDISPYSLSKGLTLTYVGYLSDGEKVTVEISDYEDWKFQITTSYSYSMFDDWGYWDSFIPAN